MVNEALINLSETLNNYHDPLSQQEDDEVEEEFHSMANDLLEGYDEADQSEKTGSENGLNMQISVLILIHHEESKRKSGIIKSEAKTCIRYSS